MCEVRNATFCYLKETQLTHTKINTIIYPDFSTQSYLHSPTLTFEESSTLFNARANTVNSFKMCFTSMNRNNLNCRLGCNSEDSLEHCMRCDVINKYTGRTEDTISSVFKTVDQQKPAIQTFIERTKVRAALIEGSGAYQGSKILDTSTPAAAGGAGERIGPLLLVAQ